MTAVFLVPVGELRSQVHLLDDLSPADTRVVSAERNFALLRSIRDDAHLGATKVVIKKILKPHAGNEQEIPAIFPEALDPFTAGFYVVFVVMFLATEFLTELSDQINELEVRRRHERIVISQQCQGHTGDRQQWT